MQKSLSGKLYLTTGLFLIIILFIGIFSILNHKTHEVASNASPEEISRLHLTYQIQLKLSQFHLSQSLASSALSPDSAQESVFLLQDNKNKLDDLLKKSDYASTDEKEKNLFSDFSASWKEYTEGLDKLYALIKENKFPDAQALVKEKLKPLLVKMQASIESIMTLDLAAISASAQTDSESSTSNVPIVVVLIVFILAAAVAFLTINIVISATKKIFESSDLLKKLGGSTSTIGVSLQASSESLSASVTRQSSSIHETSAAIDEITSMINRTSENAKESLQVAKESSKKAEEGEKIMERMVAAMETIQESSAQLQNIANIITQINSKTAVINEIVSKTELLSLNASIESARAGEHGKGFAVVAEEVGNLAKVSGKSANEIQALIQSSQEQVNQIIHSTKLRVEDGKKVTNEAQETFKKISENISNMSSVIEQITQATKEQEIGIRQISASMMEMDKVTKDNQATVNTNLEFANKLVEQSRKIDKTAKEIEKIGRTSKAKSKSE